MGYKTTFGLILFTLFLTLLAGFLSFKELFWWAPWATLLLLIIFVVLLFFFYYRLVRPMQIIENGMNLLQAQDFSSRLAQVGQKDADDLVGIFNKMMGQLRHERLHVREQNHFLDLLINASPMGVVLLDYDYNLKEMNPASQTLLEVRVPSDTIKDKSLKEVEKFFNISLSGIKMGSVEVIQLTNSNILRCSHLSFSNQGFKQPFFLIESLTDEVRQAEKKAYEKVIRMIAHEVNNTTAGVTSTLESLKDIFSDSPEAGVVVPAIDACIERSYKMSSFIVKFADVVKIPQPQMQEGDLNVPVRNSIRFMEMRANEAGIEILTHLNEAPIDAQFDAILMEQVLVNIIKNSMESIGEAGGTISVITLNNPARIIIEDNGPGIPPDIESKIFNPFFSSKPNGQGIGLLFIREVLTKQKFSFSLRTEEDGITRFRITKI